MSTSSFKKIVIIGPESTGKSTLCSQLANYHDTFWCPEYARNYLLEHGTNYSFDDLLTIAKGQINLEETFIRKAENAAKKFLFIDTDMYVMKVWCEFVFEKCHTWILDRIVERQYDLYLLCKPDLPWVKDELREYPDEATRIRLYQHYRELLSQQQTPWKEISGHQEERLQKAVQAIDELIVTY